MLSFFKKSFFNRSRGAVLGLDIGTSAVKMVELVMVNDVVELRRWAIYALPAGVINESTITNIDAVIEVFVRAVGHESIKAERVVAAVCSSHAVTSTVVVPGDLSEYEIKDQVEIEASEFVPYALDDVNLDFQVLGPSERNLDDNEVLAVACRREIVEDYVSIIEAAELQAQIVDIDTYALERVASHAHGSLGLYAVADIGYASIHLGIFDGSKVLYSRYQSIGGQQLIDLVVQHCGVDDKEAEVLIQSENPPDGYQSEVLPQFAQMVASEIARALQFFYSSSAISNIERVFVTGGVSQISGLLNQMEEELDIRVTTLNPFINIKHNFDRRHLAQVSGSLALACGLALRGVYDHH